MRRGAGLIGIVILIASSMATTARAGLPAADPASLGFDAERLKRIDGAIDRAIERGQVPGAVVLVGRRGSIAYARAAGRRAVSPKPEPMTRDTVFDMASLTKPVATATSIMILIEEGKLRLTDRLGRVLPEFDNHGKGAITIDQLLRHRAGLVPDDPIADYQDGPETAWKRLAELDLVGPPGERFRYSDVGFLILGRVVERISGRTLDEFARERIFDALEMKDAHFRRIDGPAADPEVPVERIAPTEPETRGGPDAPRRRPRPAIEGPGRRRRPCGVVRHRGRPGRLSPRRCSMAESAPTAVASSRRWPSGP